MSKNIEVAKQVVLSYFSDLSHKGQLSKNGILEIIELNSDKTNERLLEHLKALVEIFNDAIKEIEKGENNERRRSKKDN